MMKVPAPRSVTFTKQALLSASGTTEPDVAQLASAFDGLSEGLRMRCDSLLGRTTVTELFARARCLSVPEFPWVADVIGTGTGHCCVDVLHTVALGVAPDTIADGFAAALAHYVGLLSIFIGDDFA